MNHSPTVVRRKVSSLAARIGALEHQGIADELEGISNEISYFKECAPENSDEARSTNSAMVEIAARGVIRAYDLQYGEDSKQLAVKRLREALQLRQ